MRKQFLAILIIAAIITGACNNTGSTNNTKSGAQEQAEQPEASAKDIVNDSLTDGNGNVLKMTFDNAKDVLTIKLNGETAKLMRQKSASGIWYKNDTYELSGKGHDIQLKKNGTLIFEHKDEIVNKKAKNAEGDELTVSFNYTDGTAKAYLNGGEQIDLTQDKSQSETLYKNENYELSVKDDSYKLTKDGKIIFQN